MATSSIRRREKSPYFSKLSICILGYCTDMLIDLLQKSVKPKDLRALVQRYLSETLHKDHIEKLYSADVPNYEKFDINLLYILLKTPEICSSKIPTPTKGWGMYPESEKCVSVGDDIERIKGLKDFLCSRDTDRNLTEEEYKDRLCVLQGVAKRFDSVLETNGKYLRDVNTVAAEPLTWEIKELNTILTLLKSQDEENKTDIPLEIKRMDGYSVHIFKDAMKKGKTKIYMIRIMIVGHFGVGKTTLTKGLLEDIQHLAETVSTNGIDIYIGKCQIDLKNRKWLPLYSGGKDARDIYRDLALVLSQINMNDYQDASPAQNEDNNEANLIHALSSKMESLSITSPERPQSSNKDPKQINPDIKQENADEKIKFVTDEEVENNQYLPKSSKEMKGRDNLEFFTKYKDTDVMTFPVNIRTSSVEELLQSALENASIATDMKDRASVDIWDFGGQSVFYNTHQTFLSWRCIYFLAFDASKDIDDCVQDESLMEDKSAKSKVLEYILFWINSIVTYARGRFPGFPKIFLIATHLDRIPMFQRKQRIHNLFSKIEKFFVSHPARDHLIINSTFALNALDIQDPGYSLLREKVFKAASSHPLWGEEIPTSWIPLEEHLMRMKQAGIRILAIEHILHINEASSIHSLPKTEVMLFLKFQHSLGHLLYFQETNLSRFVILDPKFLIDALRSIITAERFCKDGKVKKQMWKKLSEEGLLEVNLIQQIWARDEYSEFLKFQTHLINTMEKLDLLAKPKFYSADMDEKISKDYFVPCMIKTKVPPSIYKRVLQKDRMTKLVITFKGKFLPESVFMRLLASFITMWPLLRIENKNVLFSSFGSFTLDSHHVLIIQRDNHMIIIHMMHDEMFENISAQLCVGIRHFVTSSLDRIVETYDQNTGDDTQEIKDVIKDDRLYDLLVPCCLNHEECFVAYDSDGNSKSCKHHKSSELVGKFWFTPEVTDVCHYTKDCAVSCKGPPKMVWSSVITERDLGRLSRYLISTPDILAAALEIEKDDVKTIQYDFSGSQEQKFLLLYKWRERTKSENEKPPVFESLKEIFGLLEDSIHVICKARQDRESYGSTRVYDFLKQRLFDQPSEKELEELADRIEPRKCYQLCIELGVPYVQLEKIRYDFPNKSLMQMREGLKYWKNKAKHPVKLGELAAALDETKIYSAVLREIIEEQSEDSD